MTQGTESNPDQFLGARKAAREIGISYQTMLTLIKHKKIKSVLFGERYKISRTELERFKEHGNLPEEKDHD